MPIKSCGDKRTADCLAGERVRAFEAFQKQAVKTLTRLQAAEQLKDLYRPTSNHFEALRGDHNGLYSIRINDRWRIVFRWVPLAAGDILAVPGEAHDVVIIDYH